MPDVGWKVGLGDGRRLGFFVDSNDGFEVDVNVGSTDGILDGFFVIGDLVLGIIVEGVLVVCVNVGSPEGIIVGGADGFPLGEKVFG